MPIYEYQCSDCEHKFEIIQKISDEPLKLCPDCGEQGLRKLVSAAAFRLSGSGWYETDFKDKKQQKNLSKSDDKQPDKDSKEKAGASDKKESTTGSTGSGKEKKTTDSGAATKSASSD